MLSHTATDISCKRAPGNTTQFLMGDQGGARKNFEDSDLDNSSESEDEFVKKEFAKDYDNQKPIRHKMPKSKLIEEFMTVENDVKMLEKKYVEMSAEEQLQARLGRAGAKADWSRSSVEVEPDLAEKIRKFQQEILRMAQENRTLRMENMRLISENRAVASSSSSSSSSESESSCSSDSSSEEEQEREEAVLPSLKQDVSCLEDEWQRDDTGYESDRSSGLGDRVSSTRGRT